MAGSAQKWQEVVGVALTVYWRRLSNGDVGIVTILHERMHQMDRFREDLPK